MPLTDFQSGCFICGKDLVYPGFPSEHSCYYCGKTESTEVTCSEGHFVCDKCHRSDAMDIIERFLNQTTLESPLEMAGILMNIPGIKMHGPEHHFIVPGTLVTSWCNVTSKKKFRKKWLHYAKLRAEKVPGGFCGTHGNCGAGVGTGIFISLITGATSLSTSEYRLSNRMTSQALEQIALHGGPRCCKRNTWIAIMEGVKMIKEEFMVNLPADENIICTYSHLNRECLKESCKFYKIKS